MRIADEEFGCASRQVDGIESGIVVVDDTREVHLVGVFVEESRLSGCTEVDPRAAHQLHGSCLLIDFVELVVPRDAIELAIVATSHSDEMPCAELDDAALEPFVEVDGSQFET